MLNSDNKFIGNINLETYANIYNTIYIMINDDRRVSRLLPITDFEASDIEMHFKVNNIDYNNISIDSNKKLLQLPNGCNICIVKYRSKVTERISDNHSVFEKTSCFSNSTIYCLLYEETDDEQFETETEYEKYVFSVFKNLFVFFNKNQMYAVSMAVLMTEYMCSGSYIENLSEYFDDSCIDELNTFKETLISAIKVIKESNPSIEVIPYRSIGNNTVYKTAENFYQSILDKLVIILSQSKAFKS